MIRPLLILASVATPAAAQVGFQDTAAIDVAVSDFTGHPAGEEGGARTVVDPRLKLAACPSPHLDWRGAYRDAVVVTCDAPKWRIYVPMTLHTAPAGKSVIIKRGDPITVEAGNAGFAITRDGVAMGEAAAGGRLLVKVDPAKPPIQAVAVEAGRATLPGWMR